jgi:hypothetical protein
MLVGCTSLRSLHIVVSGKCEDASDEFLGCPLALLEQVNSPVFESVRLAIDVTTSMRHLKKMSWKELVEWLEKRETLRTIECQFLPHGISSSFASSLPKMVRKKFVVYGPRAVHILRFI